MKYSVVSQKRQVDKIVAIFFKGVKHQDPADTGGRVHRDPE